MTQVKGQYLLKFVIGSSIWCYRLTDNINNLMWILIILNKIINFKDVNKNNEMLSLWLHGGMKIGNIAEKINNPLTRVNHFFFNSRYLLIRSKQFKHLIVYIVHLHFNYLFKMLPLYKETVYSLKCWRNLPTIFYGKVSFYRKEVLYSNKP